MRLLLLSDASSTHTGRWAEWFAGHGHKVLLASLEEPRVTAVPFHRLPGRSGWIGYLAAVPALRRVVREFKPDLVNAHFVTSYGLMGTLSGCRPLVASAWGSDLLVSARRSPLHRLRARWALSKADLATCDGRNLAEELLALGVGSGRIVNLPMGVERELIVRRSPEEARARIRSVISTRSLEPVYGVETIIRAMPAVVKRSNGPVNLTIVGGGRLRESLERLSRELGVEGEVDFTGRLERPELIARLDRAGIYVTASRSDSTSVSLLEAMARGLAPVASDIAGNREWLEAGANGLLFKPGDHEALAWQIVKLMDGSADAGQMAEKNHRIIRERGCWQNNMEQIESAFLKLIR